MRGLQEPGAAVRGARRVLGARDVWGVLPGLGARRIARQRFRVIGHYVLLEG